MFEAEFDTSGLDATIDRLIKQADNGYDDIALKEAGLATVAVYADETKRKFLSASHGDGRWEPLAPATIRRRSKSIFPMAAESSKGANRAAKKLGMKLSAVDFPILYVTGALYSSLSRGAEDNILEVESDMITYGTDIPYAPDLQGGTSIMPSRPIFEDVSENVIKQASELHTDAVQAAID